MLRVFLMHNKKEESHGIHIRNFGICLRNNWLYTSNCLFGQNTKAANIPERKKNF